MPPPNNRLQRTALHAAAEPERWAAGRGEPTTETGTPASSPTLPRSWKARVGFGLLALFLTPILLRALLGVLAFAPSVLLEVAGVPQSFRSIWSVLGMLASFAVVVWILRAIWRSWPIP